MNGLQTQPSRKTLGFGNLCNTQSRGSQMPRDFGIIQFNSTSINEIAAITRERWRQKL